ncbi:MAG: hypothetical protein PHD88_05410 [Firmicutes bacterium]|nr:hypothetical protein [Bacillota bacterium]MDD4263091.1 hypothetical protein [Bacillota bacterium]MDD4693818.1 hypothetical protein [Bacillota bacterium]
MQKTPNPIASSAGNIREFIATLKERGFVVQRGELRQVDILDLCSRGLVKSCFGNNAGSPYATLLLPPAPDQDPLPEREPQVDNLLKGSDEFPPISGLPLYRLRSDEAVVLIGKTPPAAHYFSFRSYLGFMENKPGKQYESTIGNESTGFYHPILASLGDQINNFNILTKNSPIGTLRHPFLDDTVIISSADKSVNDQVRNALAVAGFSSDIINDDNIPADLALLGLEKGKDLFLFLMRVQIWAQETIGQNYLDNLKQYVQVLRITPKTPFGILNPYPIPSQRTKESGITEFQVVPNARNDLDHLRKEIIKKYQTPEYECVELDTHQWGLDGYEAILSDQPAMGDNRDATYLKTDTFQLTSDDDFLIIYGINHEQTGKAMFTNTCFYGEELLNGVVGVFNSIIFANSAAEYFPEDYDDSRFYYVFMMARKANEKNIVLIPYSTGNPAGSAFGVDNYKDALVAFRIYVDKKMTVGPPLYEIIRDRAILFKKKNTK